MAQSIGEMLEEASHERPTSEAHTRLIARVLNETEITNMNQLAALVDGLAVVAARECGRGGNDEIADSLFGNAQTISDALRALHEMIQSVA